MSSSITSITIIAGSEKRIIPRKDVTIHPQYNSATLAYDIAYIYVEDPIN